MKSTDTFKNTIKAHLDEKAQTDELFAAKYANDKKNIDDCITYILNTVKQSGVAGFTDDEVFGMAVHYYQEDEVKAGSPIDCKVVVNHTVELTEEEKQEARQKAIDKYQEEQYSQMTKKKERKKEKEPEVEQLSMF